MKKIVKKINKKLIICFSLIILLCVIIILLIVPTKIKCTLNTGITNEIVNATFRTGKLKHIEVITSVSYKNNEEAKSEMKLQEIGINAIKKYGYEVSSRIEKNTIIIEYSGKVKNNKNNIYMKNTKINNFKKIMEEKYYECE